MLYRIYTEDKNRQIVEQILDENFPGYTIIQADGRWKGQSEKSLIIEVITSNDFDFSQRIKDVAAKIVKANSQESCYITSTVQDETLFFV